MIASLLVCKTNEASPDEANKNSKLFYLSEILVLQMASSIDLSVFFCCVRVHPLETFRFRVLIITESACSNWLSLAHTQK